MSVLDAGETDRTTMSPLDEVVSPASVESELMVTDMLDEHEAALHEHRELHGKRKRDTDGEELTPRKLPSLTRNNNEVGFVLGESPDDELRDDRDDVSAKCQLVFPPLPLPRKTRKTKSSPCSVSNYAELLCAPGARTHTHRGEFSENFRKRELALDV